MNILQALADEQLFATFLRPRDTWAPWRSVLRALYGHRIPVSCHDLIRTVTGRDSLQLPRQGFQEALFLTGRRSGKSRVAAIIAAFESLFGGHEARLAPGELGLVAVLAPTRWQARVVKSYLRAIFKAPLLAAEVVAETAEGFQLRNGLQVQILAGDHKAIRGFTLVCAIVDELAFFGIGDEAKVKSDTELVRALKPGLATTGGKLIGISSPYAKKGYCYRTWKRHFKNDAGTVLVVNCPSHTLNPTLSEDVVNAALAEDRAAALSEYFGEFREDIEDYTSREIVEAAVIPGRTSDLVTRVATAYSAFVDVSGGRRDSFCLCVVHKEHRGKVVVDALKELKPPLNPYVAVSIFADTLRRYHVTRVVGDAYAGEWASRAFQTCGIAYEKSPKSKSEIFIDFLPLLQAQAVELPENPRLIDQLAALERRPRSGGKDMVSKPSVTGAHDDAANAVAGACVMCAKGRIRVGGLGCAGSSSSTDHNRALSGTARILGLLRAAQG